LAIQLLHVKGKEKERKRKGRSVFCSLRMSAAATGSLDAAAGAKDHGDDSVASSAKPKICKPYTLMSYSFTQNTPTELACALEDYTETAVMLAYNKNNYE
jgi:hypothetical protein